MCLGSAKIQILDNHVFLNMYASNGSTDASLGGNCASQGRICASQEAFVPHRDVIEAFRVNFTKIVPHKIFCASPPGGQEATLSDTLPLILSCRVAAYAVARL